MTQPEYIADASVDADMDEKIRTLLTMCFTGPQDAVFKTRRYFNDPYPHRWIIRDGRGGLAAHVGVHERRVVAEGKPLRIIGIAEVCVRPDHRGRGHVRAILCEIHAWAARQGFEFSVLFGMPEVYRSSGYKCVENLFLDVRERDGRIAPKQTPAMVRELAQAPWPSAEVYLDGAIF